MIFWERWPSEVKRKVWRSRCFPATEIFCSLPRSISASACQKPRIFSLIFCLLSIVAARQYERLKSLRHTCNERNFHINKELTDKELSAFLSHIHTCQDCYEELEIYYTISSGRLMPVIQCVCGRIKSLEALCVVLPLITSVKIITSSFSSKVSINSCKRSKTSNISSV